MRFSYLWLIILFISSEAYTQVPVRQMDSKLIGKDSVNMYYDMHYQIIESGCASIIRYGHYNRIKGCLTGKFKDISKNDTSFVVSEGQYSDGGLKNGGFITHYLNGKLQAKGNFINDKYDGEWVFYYPTGHLRERSGFKDGRYVGKCEFYNEDGSPNIFMTITEKECKITDQWATDGKKIIDNGNGDYTFFDGALTWQGKLLNGVPDGIWTFQVSNAVYGSEVFKNGKFDKARNTNLLGTNEYSERSRIKFLPYPPKLAIVNADTFAIAGNTSCDGTDYSKYLRWQTMVLNKVILTSVLTGSHSQ